MKVGKVFHTGTKKCSKTKHFIILPQADKNIIYLIYNTLHLLAQGLTFTERKQTETHNT